MPTNGNAIGPFFMTRDCTRAERVVEHNDVGLDAVIADGIRNTASMRC